MNGRLQQTQVVAVLPIELLAFELFQTQLECLQTRDLAVDGPFTHVTHAPIILMQPQRRPHGRAPLQIPLDESVGYPGERLVSV